MDSTNATLEPVHVIGPLCMIHAEDQKSYEMMDTRLAIRPLMEVWSEQASNGRFKALIASS